MYVLFLYFGSLCSLDTPLNTLEIGKHLSQIAVVFDTIYHSCCILTVYGFWNITATLKNISIADKYGNICPQRCGQIFPYWSAREHISYC